jgi:PKHD-type hydroxylase
VLLETWFWVSDTPLDATLCDRIDAEAASRKQSPGKIRKGTAQEVRHSQVAWFPPREEFAWLHTPLGELVRSVNDELWGWALTEPEPAQYTVYEPGGHYRWHTDQRPKPYPGPRWPGLTRKVSVTVLLNDPDEYTGGTFELERLLGGPARARRRIVRPLADAGRGTVLVFPSHLFHRVTPVETGVRRSLVAWYLGPRFV